MKSTWLSLTSTDLLRLSLAIFRLSSGYLRKSGEFLPAIFGYFTAIFRLSPGYLRLSWAILRLSCGYLPAIFRLSSVFLGFLPAILGYLPAISWLSSCLISFLPFKSIKHYNGMNMFLLSTFDPAGKPRRANKSSKQKQV